MTAKMYGVSVLSTLSGLILTIPLKGRNQCYVHFKEAETEAQIVHTVSAWARGQTGHCDSRHPAFNAVFLWVLIEKQQEQERQQQQQQSQSLEDRTVLASAALRCQP